MENCSFGTYPELKKIKIDSYKDYGLTHLLKGTTEDQLIEILSGIYEKRYQYDLLSFKDNDIIDIKFITLKNSFIFFTHSINYVLSNKTNLKDVINIYWTCIFQMICHFH